MEKVSYPLSNIGRRAYGFAEYRNRKGVAPRSVKIEVKQSDVVSSKDALFQRIFSVNPKTLLPDGDILTFMNANTPPEVARFIEQNLMYDNGIKSDASGFEGLDDDTIAELTRNQYERVDEYAARCFDYVKNLRKQSIERQVQ